MSSMRNIVLSFISAVLISLPGWAQSVKLNTTSTPGSGQPGATVSVTGSGFPSGTISPASVTVTLAPGSVSTVATTVKSLVGTTKIVSFVIPQSISVSAPTAYAVTLSGQTTTGTAFSSTNSASLTVNPAPALNGVSPNSGKQGQTLSVAITGQYTSFVIDGTQANFGPGISVGGAGAGANGPVTVTSSTTATANLVIGSGATLGAHSVTVSTSSQTLSLNNAFTVNPASPPTAVPGGPYTEHLPVALQVDGSGSTDPNPGGTITSYTWNWGDGSPNSTGVSPSHTYLSPGTYQGSLVVADSYGQSSAPASFSVTVTGNPTAVAGGPYAEHLPAALQVNGSGSTDPNAGATLNYSWSWGDGTPNSTGASPSHTYAGPGTYSGSLTVTDSLGFASAPASFTVAVTASPTAAPGGPYTENLPTALQVDGSGSTDPNPGATITSYAWNWGDGTPNSAGVSPSHTYASAGSYQGSLVVTDSLGYASAPVTFSVNVTSSSTMPPTAVPGGPYSEQLPAAVSFDGSGSTTPNAGATITTYDWSWGDNTPDGSGAKPSHTYPSAGTYNGTLTVTDSAGAVSAAVGFTVMVTASGPPPVVAITAPNPLSVFNASGNPVTVTGTVDKDTDTVVVNGVTASVSGGVFTATGVQLREGSNVITATATDTFGNVGSASETVTLNTTPPQLGILSPSDGAVVMSSTVTVAGNVNEQVPGSINSKQVTIMVNGIAAAVSNRTFSAPNVPLVQGMNTITAMATDPAGNTSQNTIHVTYMGAIPVQKLLKISGDGQTGAVGTTLTQSLVIEAVDSNGAPVPNQQVTFTVIKSDGMLTSTTQQGQQVTAVTDQNGLASVQFQLGTRVGVGNNQVSITASGFLGEAVFTATSTVGSPAKIVAEMGDGQTGIAGQALAAPLMIEVFDAGGNPVPYVPVTFTIQAGGGTFNGNATLQVSTDINGMASALLTLGQQEGINNNVVSATFSGNPGPAASFIASGQAPGPASITSISGLVEDDSNTPVPGATITLEGTNYMTTSDVNGNFTISPAPVGTFLLKVDGHTSTRTDATFPTLVYNITTIAGLNNTLGMPVCLPPLDPTSVMTYDPSSNDPLVLQMTGIPGYVFTVAPHSAFNPDGTPYSGPLSLSQVHADRVPMAPPHGSLPLIAGTLQPPGLHFNPPVATQFPNTSALAPGTVVDLYSYDHDQMEWVSQGPARVSADGSVITSDPGFGISKSGWHFPPPPPPPPKCASSCTTSNPCQSGSCVNGACVYKPANDGAMCSDGTSGQQCGTGGKCKGGSCVFDSTATDGTACTPDDKCVMDAKCKSGQCVGKPYDTSSVFDDASLTGQVNFPTELVSAISSAISTFTGASITFTAGNLGAKGNAKNCCSQDTGPIDKGLTEASGTGQLTATLKDVPVGPGLPGIDKKLNLGITTVEILFQVGLKFGADITLNGEFGARVNQCDHSKDCHFAQVDASFEPSIYGIGEAIACVDIFGKHCAGGGIKIGVKAAITLGIRYNKPDCNAGLQGFFSAGQVTLFITGQVDLPAVYEFSFQYQPPSLQGITCSYPGGCM